MICIYRGPDSDFLKKILRVASMPERMDLPAKAQEEADLLEVKFFFLATSVVKFKCRYSPCDRALTLLDLSSCMIRPGLP